MAAGSVRRLLGRLDLRHAGVAWAVVTVVGALAIEAWSSLDPADPPDPSRVGRAIAVLRAAAEGAAAPPATDLGEALAGPVRVILWADGRPLFRGEFEGATLGDVATAAAAEIAAARERGRFQRVDLAGARFHVSFVVADGPVLSWPTVAGAASFVTPFDGIALRAEGKWYRLYPDDLLRRKLYASYLALPGGQIKAGLDLPRAIDALWAMTHLPGDAWDGAAPRIHRFRTADFAEKRGSDPVRLVAGREINPPPATVGDLRGAALEGVRFLSRQIRNSGQFAYDYDPMTDGPFDTGYSMPRHAGTAYFLAFAHRKTGDATARETARKALDWLVADQMRTCGKAPGRCVGRDAVVDIGSAALAAVAMAEYERGTGEGRFVEPMNDLVEFILWLQDPDGAFVHLYDTAADRRLPDRLLYFSGEATLALVEAFRVTEDPTLVEASRRALDHLTKQAWAFFGSKYFFSEEHWTCIAANEAYPEVQDEAYLEFCENFAGFLREMQTSEGEPPFEYEGAYIVTPFLAPRTTPVAGRTEATVATYKLGVAMGRPNPVVLEQVRRAVTFLVRMRYGPDASPFFPDPVRAAGGMPGGLDDPVVRIDYVQHAGNALIGAADLLEEYVIEPE